MEIENKTCERQLFYKKITSPAVMARRDYVALHCSTTHVLRGPLLFEHKYL